MHNISNDVTKKAKVMINSYSNESLTSMSCMIEHCVLAVGTLNTDAVFYQY